jgi:hypothetical protein
MQKEVHNINKARQYSSISLRRVSCPFILGHRQHSKEHETFLLDAVTILCCSFANHIVLSIPPEKHDNLWLMHGWIQSTMRFVSNPQVFYVSIHKKKNYITQVTCNRCTAAVLYKNALITLKLWTGRYKEYKYLLWNANLVLINGQNPGGSVKM